MYHNNMFLVQILAYLKALLFSWNKLQRSFFIWSVCILFRTIIFLWALILLMNRPPPVSVTVSTYCFIVVMIYLFVFKYVWCAGFILFWQPLPLTDEFSLGGSIKNITFFHFVSFHIIPSLWPASGGQYY